MKKVLLRLFLGAVGLLIAVVLFLGGLSTEDYNLTCTRCLRSYFVVEKKWWGITYRRTQKLDFAGHDLTALTGRSCDHVYRTQGFGRSTWGMIGCGDTAEGVLFRPRWMALHQAFALDDQFHDKALLQQTLALIDSLMPFDATLDFYKDSRFEKSQLLLELYFYLEPVKSPEEWKAALVRTQNDIAHF